VSNGKYEPEESNEDDLIRAEFDSIVSGLSLDESTPSTYLDDLDRIDQEGFIAPNPPGQSPRGFFASAQRAIKRWLSRDNREDDGATL
jgi:hypothetical protein